MFTLLDLNRLVIGTYTISDLWNGLKNPQLNERITQLSKALKNEDVCIDNKVVRLNFSGIFDAIGEEDYLKDHTGHICLYGHYSKNDNVQSIKNKLKTKESIKYCFFKEEKHEVLIIVSTNLGEIIKNNSKVLMLDVYKKAHVELSNKMNELLNIDFIEDSNPLVSYYLVNISDYSWYDNTWYDQNKFDLKSIVSNENQLKLF